MATDKLKITDKKGNVRIVPFNSKTLDLHMRKNKLEHDDNKQRIEHVASMERDEAGNIIDEGTVVKVYAAGSVDTKKLIAKANTALADKDKEIEELKKKLAAADKATAKADKSTGKDAKAEKGAEIETDL